MSGRPWTQTEIDVLRSMWATVSCATIAAVMRRSRPSIYTKAAALGLEKSPEFLASTRLNGSQGRATRFRAGQAAWNKGRPGSTGLHPNSRRTQFQAGEMRGAAQHNYVPIGTLRLSKDGYLERKLTDDPALYPARRWVAVHRLVWEEANGPVPPGHLVVFRPGMRTTDPDEITLESLECITRAENMRRNTIHNYPPELVEAMRARAVLNRRINRERENHQRSA